MNLSTGIQIILGLVALGLHLFLDNKFYTSLKTKAPDILKNYNVSSSPLINKFSIDKLIIISIKSNLSDFHNDTELYSFSQKYKILNVIYFVLIAIFAFQFVLK